MHTYLSCFLSWQPVQQARTPSSGRDTSLSSGEKEPHTTYGHSHICRKSARQCSATSKNPFVKEGHHFSGKSVTASGNHTMHKLELYLARHSSATARERWAPEGLRPHSLLYVGSGDQMPTAGTEAAAGILPQWLCRVMPCRPWGAHKQHMWGQDTHVP